MSAGKRLKLTGGLLAIAGPVASVVGVALGSTPGAWSGLAMFCLGLLAFAVGRVVSPRD